MSSNVWVWPVPVYKRISSTFGYRKRPVAGASTNHKGIDIAADYGALILAACDGEVISSGPADGFGQWIRIDHGNGIISVYGHMQKRNVKVGDTVVHGQIIAEVGSEGRSSGPHLHFQIEVNGTPVDPEKYVSPDSNISVVPSDFSGTEDEDSELPFGYYGTVEAGGTTIGQRVSGATPQPIHAFVNIYVGDNKLLLATDPARPNIIQSFEYVRLDGAAETVMLSLYDENWEEIEEALSANFDNIFIKYGYYGTGVESDMVRLRLLDYNINFVSTGAILSVQATTEGAVQNLKPRSISLNTFNPTEAVKKICTELGYKILDENFDSSQDIIADNPFNLIETFPITYIQSFIIPQASQENEELFRFYIDSKGYAYFKRISYNTTKTDNLRTYIYQKGYDSDVIDFSVDIKAVFGGTGDFELATGYRSSVFDTKSKEQEYQEVDKTSVITEATGDITHTDSSQSNPVVDSSGYSASQMKSKLYYHMKSRIHDAYEATLTIVGDPTIDFINDRYVRVINVTDKGYLHHTSGVYWIEGITDTISGGEMTTSMKLVKNATAGDIDGVEIINPKYRIK